LNDHIAVTKDNIQEYLVDSEIWTVHFFNPNKGRGRVKHRAILPHRDSKVWGSYDGTDAQGKRIHYDGLLFHHELEAGHVVMAWAIIMLVCLLSATWWFLRRDAATAFGAASFLATIFGPMLAGLIAIFASRPLRRLSAP